MLLYFVWLASLLGFWYTDLLVHSKFFLGGQEAWSISFPVSHSTWKTFRVEHQDKGSVIVKDSDILHKNLKVPKSTLKVIFLDI